MNALRELYRRFDAERDRAVKRRMRRSPTSMAGVMRQVEDDGAAWVSDLAGTRGLTLEEVVELIDLVDRDTTKNLAAMLHAGALSPVDGIRAGIGAGVGVGLMIGFDLAKERPR